VREKGAILKNVLYLPSLPPPAPPCLRRQAWQGGEFFSFLPLTKSLSRAKPRDDLLRGDVKLVSLSEIKKYGMLDTDYGLLLKFYAIILDYYF